MRQDLAVARSRWRERRDPVVRQHVAEVHRGLKLPHSRDLPIGSGGAVWAVGLVKNEADILETSLRHMAGQGVDVILVADNGSTDGSVDIVRELRHEGLPVVGATDLESQHHQGHKITVLAQFAAKHGASWIIPFDADELWFADDQLVAERLVASDTPTVLADIHNVAPVRPHVRVGADHGWVIGDRPAALFKVAFRPHPFMRVFDGNHAVDRPGPVGSGLHIAHIPYRSYEQLVRKVRRGMASVDRLPPHVANHWRSLGVRSDEDLAGVWDAMVAGQSPEGTGWVPEGRTWAVDVTTWRTWQLPARSEVRPQSD